MKAPVKKGKKRAKKSLGTVLLPGSGRPSNPSQVMVRMKLQGPILKVNTQPTTALLDNAVVLPSLASLSQVSSISAVYDEWRLTGIDFLIQMVGLNNGQTKFVLDDEDSTSPNATWMNSRIGYYVPNNSCAPGSKRIIHYRSEDLDDLEWQSCATASTYTPMALKMYTSATEYGTTASVALFTVSWIGHFEFRGIGAKA